MAVVLVTLTFEFVRDTASKYAPRLYSFVAYAPPTEIISPIDVKSSNSTNAKRELDTAPLFGIAKFKEAA